MQAQVQNQFIDTITQGDCIEVMRQMPANSADFILTDPPYLVNFCDRQGRTLQNDTNANWLKPAVAEAYRVLRQNRLMLCFYGWTHAEKFLQAWREADFRPVGHLVFRKSYTTKATDFLKYQVGQGRGFPEGLSSTPPTEPDVTVSRHPAPITASSACKRAVSRSAWSAS